MLGAVASPGSGQHPSDGGQQGRGVRDLRELATAPCVGFFSVKIEGGFFWDSASLTQPSPWSDAKFLLLNLALFVARQELCWCGDAQVEQR